MPDFERLILNRDLKRIVPLLASRRSDVRLRAVQALGEARAWRAVGTLRDMLADPEPIVRTAVLDALVAIRRPESLDIVVNALRSAHRDVVEHAWRVLDRAGDEGHAAVARALPAFREDEATLERMLAHLDSSVLGSELIALLDHPDEAVVQRAREKLVAKGARADEALVEALLSGAERQARAIAALLRPRVGELVPVLVARYASVGDPERQRMLLYLLAEARTPVAADLLESELRSPHSRVRTTALALLSRYRERAVVAFKKLLKDPDFPDRGGLIAYVRQHWRLWGEALIDLLAVGEFDEWRVREFAKMALGGRRSLLPLVVERYLEQGDLSAEDVADLLLFDRAAMAENLALLGREPPAAGSERAARLAELLERVILREGPAAVALLTSAARAGACAAPRLFVRALARRVAADAAAAPALVSLLRHGAATSEPEARAGRLRREALEVVLEDVAATGPHLVQALALPGAPPELSEAVVRAGDQVLPGLVSALVEAWREGRDWRTYSSLLARMAGARVDVILPLFDHPEPDVQQAAFAAARGRKGDEIEAAVGAIVNEAVGLREVAPRVLWALDVLSGLRGLVARSAMQRLVSHPDRRVREQALRYVRRMVRFPSGVWERLDELDDEAPAPSDPRRGRRR